MIGVKNKTDAVIKSRYDGQDFEFKPGVTVAVSEDAATHIFGYGLDDKSRALIRLGWLINSTQYEGALARLDDIQFFAEGKVVFDEPADIKTGMKMAESPAGSAPMKIPVLGEKQSSK